MERKLNKNRYLYMITPTDVGEETADWSGSIDAVKKMIKKGNKNSDEKIRELNHVFTKELSMMHDLLDKVSDTQEDIADQVNKIELRLDPTAQVQ